MMKILDIREKETGRFYNAFFQHYVGQNLEGTYEEYCWNVGIEGYLNWHFIYRVNTKRFFELYDVIGVHDTICADFKN